jgi:hypothetical protein
LYDYRADHLVLPEGSNSPSWGPSHRDDPEAAKFALLRYTDKFFIPESFRGFPEGQIVNKIPFMEKVCSKTTFFQLLRENARKFQSKYQPAFIPTLFILPEQAGAFVATVASGKVSDRWIFKPKGGQCGYGIQLVFGGDVAFAKSLANECGVVQEYLSPLLFGDGEGPWVRDPGHHPVSFSGHKWDCRFYLLLMHNISKTPFSVYFYNDGLLKFCSDRYVDPSPGNWNPFSQITNLAANVKNPNLTCSPIKLFEDVSQDIVELVQFAQNA